ncbi:hypothetical protein MEZE111188_15235 [Mesobacillus zeae]
MNIKPLKLFLLTFVCSLIFSIVFITVARIDAYFNPPSAPPISIKKIK